MAKLTRRQRLKRDPANQSKGKFLAWAAKHPATVKIVLSGRDPRPFMRWRKILWMKRLNISSKAA